MDFFLKVSKYSECTRFVLNCHLEKAERAKSQVLQTSPMGLSLLIASEEQLCHLWTLQFSRFPNIILHYKYVTEGIII